MANNLNFIRQQYEMPWLKCGLKVEHLGLSGQVIGGTPAGKLRVKLNEVRERENGIAYPSQDGKHLIVACDPDQGITYYSKTGKVLADYSEQGEAS